MTIVALAACVAAILTCAPARASTPQGGLIDLPTATVQMSWTDIKALIEAAQPPTPPTEEEERPPVEWSLASAEYDAEVVSPESVRITGRFQVVVWKREGWVQIPIIGDSVAPSSATLDGEETSLLRTETGTFTLLLDEPGAHSLELVFFVACTDEDGVVGFTFPCIPTAVTHMKLEIPVRDAQVRSPMAANISVERGEDSLTADLVFRSAEQLDVSWTLPALMREEAPEKPPEPARISCLTSTLASVTDHYIACHSLLRYDVLRGKTEAFRLRAPKGVNIHTVEGQGAEWSQTEDEDGQVIEVKVNHQVEDNYELEVRYEAPFDNEMATLKVPELVAEGVLRSTGFIGVTARGAVEIEPGPEITGLVRVDASELPVSVRSMSPNVILLAYKYTEADYVLSLDVRRLEDVPVRVASIDHAKLTTVVTDDGMAVTEAVYFVRNNVKQFLRVDLEKDVEVWGAEVCGQPVKPAREPDSDTVLIPLLKSVETNRQLGAFPVSLKYMERLGQPRGLTSKLGLETPATDILANEIEWEVWLPEERRLYRAAGDLRQKKRVFEHVARLVRRTKGTQTETIYALREGIQRFYIRDINNPAGTLVGEPRYEGRPLPAAKKSPPAGVAIAGVLPVRITLPTAGAAHHFSKVLVPQRKTLSLTLYTYDGRLNRAGYLVVLAVAFAAALWLGRWITRRFSGKWRWVLLPIVLCLAGVAGLLVIVTHDVLLALPLAGLLAGLILPTAVKSRPLVDAERPAAAGDVEDGPREGGPGGADL